MMFEPHDSVHQQYQDRSRNGRKNNRENFFRPVFKDSGEEVAALINADGRQEASVIGSSVLKCQDILLLSE